jgi:hypothetical protein
MDPALGQTVGSMSKYSIPFASRGVILCYSHIFHDFHEQFAVPIKTTNVALHPASPSLTNKDFAAP